MPSSHLILGRPLLLLPPIPPSIKVFSNESALRMRWPKYWSFSFSIIPSKEIPGLVCKKVKQCHSSFLLWKIVILKTKMLSMLYVKSLLLQCGAIFRWRHNSYNIKFIISKCTFWWFLVHSLYCATITTV